MNGWITDEGRYLRKQFWWQEKGALDLEYVLIMQHLIKAYYLSQTMISFASKVVSSFPFPQPPVMITTLNRYPLFNLIHLRRGYTPNEAASPPFCVTSSCWGSARQLRPALCQPVHQCASIFCNKLTPPHQSSILHFSDFLNRSQMDRG